MVSELDPLRDTSKGQYTEVNVSVNGEGPKGDDISLSGIYTLWRQFITCGLVLSIFIAILFAFSADELAVEGVCGAGKNGTDGCVCLAHYARDPKGVCSIRRKSSFIGGLFHILTYFGGFVYIDRWDIIQHQLLQILISSAFVSLARKRSPALNEISEIIATIIFTSWYIVPCIIFWIGTVNDGNGNSLVGQLPISRINLAIYRVF